MSRYRLTDSAEVELGEILDWSESRFGVMARDRYLALILAALRDVADDPKRKSVHWHRIGTNQIGVYHIANSRDRTPPTRGRVAEPRHYVIFSLGDEDGIVVLGFVHERMLLSRAFRRLMQQ